MIKFTSGNIFDAPTEAITNPVNCVGVMGAGLALAFKKRFPDAYTSYVRACNANLLRPGLVHIYTLPQGSSHKYIVHFPTKAHYLDTSSLPDICDTLRDLTGVIKVRGIKSIAVPALGCGLGGLNWADVKVAIVNNLDAEEVLVYEPL